MKERTVGLVMPKTCESCVYHTNLKTYKYKDCEHQTNLKWNKDAVVEVIQKPEEKNPENKCKYHFLSDNSRKGEVSFSINGKNEEGLRSLLIETGIELMVSFTAFPFILIGVFSGIARKGFRNGHALGEEMWKLYHKIKGVKDER